MFENQTTQLATSVTSLVYCSASSFVITQNHLANYFGIWESRDWDRGSMNPRQSSTSLQVVSHVLWHIHLATEGNNRLQCFSQRHNVFFTNKFRYCFPNYESAQ